MAQFGASIQTAQVTSGNFQTTVDPYVSGYAGYPNNPGARNQVGAAYYDATGTFSNPYGVPGKYRYVRYYDSANTAIAPLTAPAICYWLDTTYTTVTPLYQSSIGGIAAVAGLIMPNLTALPSLVLATTGTGIGQTPLNGNYIWICVGGYVSGALGIVSLTAGSTITGPGSSTPFLPAFTTSATANRILGWAQSAAGASPGYVFNILVTLES